MQGLTCKGSSLLFLSIIPCLFFSAAFPLGGASIISENPDAFGVLSALTFTGSEKYLILIPEKYL